MRHIFINLKFLIFKRTQSSNNLNQSNMGPNQMMAHQQQQHHPHHHHHHQQQQHPNQQMHHQQQQPHQLHQQVNR